MSSNKMPARVDELVKSYEFIKNHQLVFIGKLCTFVWKIIKSDMPVEKIKGRFSIVTANLRYPTLISLYPQDLK